LEIVQEYGKKIVGVRDDHCSLRWPKPVALKEKRLNIDHSMIVAKTIISRHWDWLGLG